MSSYDFDKYFPLLGTCYHCGRDLRVHKLEDIVNRFSRGESVSKLADDLNVPPQAIELVIARNSASPTGRTTGPLVRVAAA
jgi:hypothetical protein